MAIDIGINADIDLKGWNQGVRQMEGDANDLDSAMSDVRDSINAVERTANSTSIDISPTVDDSELKAAEDTINDVRSDLARLDGASATPNIEPEGEGETRRELEDIQAKLDVITALSGISVAINFLTNLDDIVEQLRNIPGLGSLLDLEQAGANFAAQTGQDTDAVEDLITSLYTGEDAIIATRDEIAQMAAATYQATRNFNTLEDDVIAVNNVAETFGQDFNEVLATANQLVQAGLAENITEATDIIAAGFQSGANRGGDLLDVLNEYATTFAEAGFTGGQAIGAINAGLDAGAGNADRAADAIRELGIKAKTAGDSAHGFDQGFEDAAIAAGVLDEAIAFRSGEMGGAEFLTAISEGLSTIADEGERAAAAAGLFGTQAEDLGAGVVGNLGTAEDFDNLEGRAQEAADTIHDTLTRSLQEFSQEIDQAFVEILDAANVDEWINEARGKLGTFLEELRGGRGIGEALEIALEIPGLADTLLQIQSVLQDVGIGLLQGIQALLQVTGHADIASGMQGTIEGLGQGQLGFAASVADESEDIAAAVASATSRGLSRAEIGATLEEQLQQAIATGNLEAARAILGAAEGGELFPIETSITQYEGQIENLATGLQAELDDALRSGDFATAGLLADDLGTTLEDEFERALSAGDFNLAAIIAENLGDADLTGRVMEAAFGAGLDAEEINTILNNALDVVEGIGTMSTDVETSVDDLNTTLEDASLSFEEMEQVVTERSTIAGQSYSAFASVVINESANAEGAIQRLIDKWGDLQAVSGGGVPAPHGGGNAPTPDGNAAGGTFTGLSYVGERGIELASSNVPLHILNNHSTEALLTAMASVLSGGGFSGNTSNTTNNINVIMNNNGAAAGTASGNRVSDMVRGYG